MGCDSRVPVTHPVSHGGITEGCPASPTAPVIPPPLPLQDHALGQFPDGKRTFIPAALGSQQVMDRLIPCSPCPQAGLSPPWAGGGPGDPPGQEVALGTPLGRRWPPTPRQGPPLEGSLSSPVPQLNNVPLCHSPQQPSPSPALPSSALEQLTGSPPVPPAPKGSLGGPRGSLCPPTPGGGGGDGSGAGLGAQGEEPCGEGAQEWQEGLSEGRGG